MQNIERIYFRDWNITPGVRGDGAHEVAARFSVQVANDPTPAGQEFHRLFGYRVEIKGDPRTSQRGIPRDDELVEVFTFTRTIFRPRARWRNGRLVFETERSETDVFPFNATSTVVGSDLGAGSREYTTWMHRAQVAATDLDVAEGAEVQLPRMFGGGFIRLAAEDRIYAIVSIVEYATGRVVRTLRSHADRDVYEGAPA